MYLVSVILPTRGRFDMCCKSIDSLLNKSKNLHDIEVLIGYDNDDTETTLKLKSYYMNNVNIKFFEYPRFGYKYLHKYVNDLSFKSNGNWLLLWNDDAIMETEHWDEIIRSYNNNFVCICPASNIGYCGLFPIIPRKWIEITGHFSLNCSNDTWVEDVSNSVGIKVDDTRIYIMHDRADLTGNNKDTTYIEREYDSEKYREQVELRNIDSGKISQFLLSVKSKCI